MTTTYYCHYLEMDGLDSLIFMGLKHCGKSSLGRCVAERFKLDFEDLDHLIMKSAAKEGYGSIRELYRSVGIKKFQVYETVALRQFFSEATDTRRLIALGGGTVENREVMNMLGSRGFLVYLSVDEQLLYDRIIAGGIPPFLEGEQSPRELFRLLYDRRASLFQSYADLQIPLPDQSIRENTELIYSTLKEKIHVR